MGGWGRPNTCAKGVAASAPRHSQQNLEERSAIMKTSFFPGAENARIMQSHPTQQISMCMWRIFYFFLKFILYAYIFFVARAKTQRMRSIDMLGAQRKADEFLPSTHPDECCTEPLP